MSTSLSLVGRSAFSATNRQWNDWKWQLAKRLSTPEDLSNYLVLSKSEKKGLIHANTHFSVAITPYLISLMEKENENCPIRRQLIPTHNESYIHPSDLIDPLGEEPYSTVPGIIHKYPDRALYLPTDHCASYCRHCTRSRLVNKGSLQTSTASFEKALAYIQNTPALRDILITGGDPLTMNTDMLCQRISRINEIKHIEMIRLGTRVPSFLPQRITKELVRSLRRAGVLYLSLHFNHPREITPEVENALRLLADGGLVLGNQSVLLKGINDEAPLLKELFHLLLRNRVTPYYLHHCDSVQGTSHLRTPLQTGIDILKDLRGHTTGYAVPTLALDLPGGGGKISLGPDYLLKREGKHLVFENYKGEHWKYHEV